MLPANPGNGKTFCVLGVDPAAAGATGFGIVESDGRRCRLLRFGALRPPVPGGSLATHLCGIHSLMAELIAEFAPAGVAVEAVFTGLNRNTAFRLAEVRGVVLLAAAQAGVPTFSYTPRAVKASVAGYGQADKQQVQQMVRALLGMTETPEPADAADALAVALCHIQVAETQARWSAQELPAGRSPRRTSRRHRAALPGVAR